MTEQPQKRIVSKGEYVRRYGKKMWLYFSSVSALVIMPLVCYSLAIRGHHHSLWFYVPLWALPLLFLQASIMAARKMFQEARAFPVGVPLTRANVGDIPAVDSLVRPSDTPASQHQAELLRAAGQGSETPSDQLLRATVKNSQDV